MIFGVHAVEEAIRSGKEIERILVNKVVKSPNLKALIQEARDNALPVIKVPQEKLDKITRKNHQGVICFLAPINYASLDNILENCWNEGKDPFLLIMDRITDVRNFGAIVRTAECAGIDAVIVPGKNSARISGDTVKTSSGAINYMPIVRAKNLVETVDFLRESGVKIVSCTEKTDNELFDSDLTGPIAIVMGNEETGIAGDILVRSDIKAKIPMYGKVESLNVGVSAGIIMYQVVKARL